MTMKKKPIQRIAITCATIGVSIVIYCWLANQQIAALSPPSASVSFADFAEQMPAPRVLTEIHLRNGQKRIVWMSDVATMIIPSGGSCYVFDESGVLLQWSPTTGDGESIDNIWKQAIDRKPVTIEQVMKTLNAA